MTLLSSTGMSIMQIKATDRDEMGNLNSKIRYRLVNQEPAGDKMMFMITSDGELRVKEPNLDREVSLQHTLSLCHAAPLHTPTLTHHTEKIRIEQFDVTGLSVF